MAETSSRQEQNQSFVEEGSPWVGPRPHTFLRFYFDFISVQKKCQKKLDQYSAILTSTLVNNAYAFFHQ